MGRPPNSQAFAMTRYCSSVICWHSLVMYRFMRSATLSALMAALRCFSFSVSSSAASFPVPLALAAWKAPSALSKPRLYRAKASTTPVHFRDRLGRRARTSRT
eukprot:Skav201819  [mRNA]  locus=scaffold1071:340856:343554:- [translate_table: standard]